MPQGYLFHLCGAQDALCVVRTWTERCVCDALKITGNIRVISFCIFDWDWSRTRHPQSCSAATEADWWIQKVCLVPTRGPLRRYTGDTPTCVWSESISSLKGRKFCCFAAWSSSRVCNESSFEKQILTSHEETILLKQTHDLFIMFMTSTLLLKAIINKWKKAETYEPFMNVMFSWPSPEPLLAHQNQLKIIN